MQFEEYGKHGLPVVLLLHKGGLSDWKNKERLKQLDGLYHLIVPILTDTDAEATFKTEVTEISNYIRKQHGGRVFAVCSMTDSWEIANSIMLNKAVLSDKTIVEIDGTPGDMIVSSLEEIAEPVFCHA